MFAKKGEEVAEIWVDELKKERKATQKEIVGLKKSLEEERDFLMKYLKLRQTHCEKVDGLVRVQQLLVILQKEIKDMRNHMATVAEKKMATVKMNHQVEIQAEVFKAKLA